MKRMTSHRLGKTDCVLDGQIRQLAILGEQ
jgi:hypothetical protein